MKASRVNEKAQSYDPLASLLLYGVTYQEKGREKFVEKKLTKQPEAAEEACIGDTESAKSTEFEEDIEMLQKDAKIIAREIRGSTEIPEKSIQTNLQKSKRYKKSAKTPHTDAKIFKACLKEKKDKRDEKGRKKWIDKCEYYKERYKMYMTKKILKIIINPYLQKKFITRRFTVNLIVVHHEKNELVTRQH